MEIVSHCDDSGVIDSIVVREARTVEQIAVEIFERADPRWLQIWDFEDGPEGVKGSFRITASNGEWTYRFTRKLWHLDGVYEAELALGEVLENPAWTTGMTLRPD